MGVFRFDQDDVTVVFGVVRAAGWAVGRDELLDEFLDDGVAGVMVDWVVGSDGGVNWPYGFLYKMADLARCVVSGMGAISGVTI